jgi:hypothetical protein
MTDSPVRDKNPEVDVRNSDRNRSEERGRRSPRDKRDKDPDSFT